MTKQEHSSQDILSYMRDTKPVKRFGNQSFVNKQEIPLTEQLNERRKQ